MAWLARRDLPGDANRRDHRRRRVSLPRDISLYNKARRGATGSRSGGFTERVRICHFLLELCSMSGLLFISFGECTLMGRADEQRIGQAIGWSRIALCPSGAATARRPRNYCTSAPVKEVASGSKGRLEGPFEPVEFWVVPEWQWPGGQLPGAHSHCVRARNARADHRCRRTICRP